MQEIEKNAQPSKCLVNYHNQCIKEILHKCSDRLMELDQIEAEIEELEQQERESSYAPPEVKVISNELLMRYENHINRHLHQALEKLEAFQLQRQKEVSMGSFG